jgi:IS605 OrfB family transposase
VIRIGERHPRSVTLPKIGTIRVHNETRRLRPTTAVPTGISYQARLPQSCAGDPPTARQTARISRVRRSFLHEVSSQLVKTHDRLCLEGLAIANLVRNKHLARAIGDAAWAEFARQVGYKAAWFGAELVVADRWFPSTKTCSRCGKVNQEVQLTERVFPCAVAGWSSTETAMPPPISPPGRWPSLLRW